MKTGTGTGKWVPSYIRNTCLNYYNLDAVFTCIVRNEKKNHCYMYHNVRCSKKPRTIVSVVDQDPPLFCTGPDPDPSIISKKVRKTLTSTTCILRLLFYFLSMKTDVNAFKKAISK
jgi:hypothetical protein